MEEKENIIVLVDEDDNEIEFEYLDSVEYNGENFAILIPLEDEDGEEGVVIMHITTDEEGDDILDSIDDSDVLDAVFEIFKNNNSDDFEFVE